MNDGKICISVFASTADRMIEKIRIAEQNADLVEVRFDHLAETEFTPDAVDRIFRAKSSIPWIATFRAPEQGGGRSLSLDERKRFWANVSGSEYVDIEEDIDHSDIPAGKQIIRSHHDFTGMPADLDAIYRRLATSGADIIKIAYAADDITDTIPVWKLLELARLDSRDIIAIAMGDAGKLTRVLGLARGAFLTYSSLDGATETAPGQVTAKDLIEVYRAQMHSRDTLVFGVIGDPISQSLSPYMHNPAFQAAGIDGVFVPLLVKDIGAFMGRMVKSGSREVELNFGGFSVTMPHKQSIMPFLDALDPTAEAIGAVNTVKIENGVLTGSNTDAHGFITPLIAKVGDVRNARVAVFGAGGAARAVVYVLKQHGADITIFARDVKKANDLAAEFGVAASGIETTGHGPTIGASFDILVDATPLGMKGPMEHETLFTAAELDGLKLVFDLVTKGVETPILREARLAGIPTIGGVDMLIAQGARQFEIWTEKQAPLELMRTAVLERMNYLQK